MPTEHAPGGRERRRLGAGMLAVNLAVSVSTVAVTLVVLEVAYRAREYVRLAYGGGDAAVWTLDASPYLFAPDIGFRYRPNTNVLLQLVGADNEVRLANRFRVNNHGHVSLTDDTIQKPHDQFRIAVLGNSFTASVNQNTPWPSLLEQRLNADGGLRDSLGASSVKVLNFGLEGTGIVQWNDVFLHDSRRYDPDLVLINFLSDDIRRRYSWRDVLPMRAAGYEVQLPLICSSLPVDIENRDCALARTLVVQPAVVEDPNALAGCGKNGHFHEATLAEVTQ